MKYFLTKICITQINLLNEFFFLTQGDDAVYRKKKLFSLAVAIHAYQLITVGAGDSLSLTSLDRLREGAYNL